MGDILLKDKEIAVPGECLATSMDYIPGHGTYREGDSIYCKRLGLMSIDSRALHIIPLSGVYMPKKGDTIIGKVTDVIMSGWLLDINCAYHSMLSMKEGSSDFIPKGANLRKYFDFGDYVVCYVTNVTSQKLVDVSTKGPGLYKLNGGRIITINTTKVPRVIGKNGSMVSMIKDATKCKVTVGQNGRVWISGEPKDEIIAIAAIKMIEKNSHKQGLTDNVKEFLDKQKSDSGDSQ